MQPYFGNTRLMKVENDMSVISIEFYLQGAECNICCCFCDVCPWAVFLLLHILFSAEQVHDFLHNLCFQGVNLVFVAVFVLYVHGLYLFCCTFCSVEQVFVPLYLCLQGCYVFLHVFPFYQIKFLSLSQKKKKKNFVNTTGCNLLASFGFVERLMGS